MRLSSFTIAAVLALMAGVVFAQAVPWVISQAMAATLLDGRIVQDTTGLLWLVRGDTRHPISPVAIDDSDLAKLAVGAPFERLTQGVVALPGDNRQVVTSAAGQQATSDFSGSPIRATVREMTITNLLPETPGPYSFSAPSPAVMAQGKFVVVLVDAENVGTQPVCCFPGYRLKDSKGRFFSGLTNDADALVKQAKRAFYSIDSYPGDLQPNLPRPQVLVYDVPTDAERLSIAAR